MAPFALLTFGCLVHANSVRVAKGAPLVSSRAVEALVELPSQMPGDARQEEMLLLPEWAQGNDHACNPGPCGASV